MDKQATGPEPSSRGDPATAQPASVPARKSEGGEFEYLLECLHHPFPVGCVCVENILSGRESACLKYRIAKLVGARYDPGWKQQSGKCTCGGGAYIEEWDEEDEEEEGNLSVEKTGDANVDDEDTGPLAEPAEPSCSGGGRDPEAGVTIGADSDVIYCEEHGGLKGNRKRLCDTCKELYGSAPEATCCQEHGGWEGNLKRPCGACQEVYGSPYQCSGDGCPAKTHGW